MTNLVCVSRKLIMALNTLGIKYTLSTKQFVDKHGQHRNLFIISSADWDDEKHRYVNHELYSTSSAVRITLYLRDVWYKANGWELPKDFPLWNDIRASLEENNG